MFVPVVVANVSFETICNVLDTLTDCKAELEHMDSPFLLQEVHKTEEKVLLLSDFLQLQLQHLVRENSGDKICPWLLVRLGSDLMNDSAYCDDSMYRTLYNIILQPSGGLMGTWYWYVLMWSEVVCSSEETLTEAFLLRTSEYFCRKGTSTEVGSVASSGWRDKTCLICLNTQNANGTACSQLNIYLQGNCRWISKVNGSLCPEIKNK